MRPLARELLAGREDAPVHLAYGTATATNTVRMDGETTAVVMPALAAVAAGQRAAVLKSGGDRLIVGSVTNRTFGVYASTTSIPSGSFGQALLTATYDPVPWLGVSNVIPTIPGWYRVTLAVVWPSAAYTTVAVRIRKNDTATSTGVDRRNDTTSATPVHVTAFVQMNGTTDHLDFDAFQDSGSDQAVNAQMGVEYLGPA